MIYIKSLKNIAKHLVNRLFNRFNRFNLNRMNVIHGRLTINGIIKIVNSGKLVIGENCVINSGSKYNPIGGDNKTQLVCRQNGELVLEDGVKLSNSTIYCVTKITIGKNTFIGGSCRIWDTNFHSIHSKERVCDLEVKNKPIKIGANCFIGAGVIITKGVEVGENSVIGAGSVVVKNVPKNEIWAGNPAMFIKNI
jgi:serine acetyltransferase